MVLTTATKHPYGGTTSDGKLWKSLPSDTLGVVDVPGIKGVLGKILDQIEKKGRPDAQRQKTLQSARVLVDAMGNETSVALFPKAGGAPAITFVADVRDQPKAISALDDLAALGNVPVSDSAVSGGKGWQIDNGENATYIAVARNRFVAGDDANRVKAAVEGNGDLGDNDKVSSSISDVSEPTKLLAYFDVKTLEQKYGNHNDAGAMSESDKTTQKWIDSVSHIGFKSWNDDDHDYAELKIKVGK